MLVTEVPFPLYIVISHADFSHKKNNVKHNQKKIFFQFSTEKHITVNVLYLACTIFGGISIFGYLAWI